MRWLIWRRGVVGLGAAPWPYNASATLSTPQPVSRYGVVRSGRSGCFADALADFPMRRRGRQRAGCFVDATAGFPTQRRGLATLWLLCRRRGWFRDVASGAATRRLLWQRCGGFPDEASGEDDALAALPTPRLVC